MKLGSPAAARLLESAPDAMVVVNQHGEIALLNLQAERQFGYQRAELVGQRVKDIIPGDFEARLGDGVEAAARQTGAPIQLTGRRKDGSSFPIDVTLSRIDDSHGVAVTLAIRDVTVQQQAQAQLLEKLEELNRSNEDLRQFTYVASHDLQQPLRMVASFTELLSRRYKGRLDADADDYIRFAVDGARRMQQLIEDLLAYSRIGSEGRAMRRVSSEEALRQALMNLARAIEESGAIVTHDPLPAILADKRQLIQLFQNLVANAIQYRSAASPRVHISAVRHEPGEWTFAVRDNGQGIEAQHFERIFGVFQRLHNREELFGTGIGLAICKRIVERHGSRIAVESEPGKGSTFRFALPADGQ
jgi:PAS domain S-box-containing protein